MNVCMLVWSYWPVPTGGAEGQCRKLSRYLAERDVRCTVLTARLQVNTSGGEKDGLVDVVRVPVPQMWIERINEWRNRHNTKRTTLANLKLSNSLSSQSHPLPTAQFIGKVVRWMNSLAFMIGATIWFLKHRRAIDVIHVHIADWVAGYAGWIGGCLGIPVVCKAANLPVFPILDASVPFRGSWEGWRRKINYVAMHEAIRDELIEAGVAQEKIRIIPNGVEEQREKIKPLLAREVLFVGNFSQGPAHKGFDVLLGAWQKVSSEKRDARLVMAGHGDTTPWQRLVDNLGCSDTVHFTGYVQNVNDLYRKAALFVLPSRHEGMSNALLEAQSWGVPAIVSDIPGNRAVVSDGITGLIVPVGDQKALAEAILSLLNDPDTLAEMGLRARNRIYEHFTMNRITEKYLALYDELI